MIDLVKRLLRNRPGDREPELPGCCDIELIDDETDEAPDGAQEQS